MKTFSKQSAVKCIAGTALSLAAFAPVFALQQVNSYSEDYSIQAYKDCQLILEQPMTQAQIETYEALKDHEALMKVVELEVEGIEDQLKQFTDKIESLTELAVQETEDTLFIDKHMLKQQEDTAKQLEAFMSQHRHKYEAIAQQGNAIGKAANAFTQSLEADIAHLDYDNIRIGGAKGSRGSFNCNGKEVSKRL